MPKTAIDKMALVAELAKRRFAWQGENSIKVMEIGGTTDSAYRELFEKTRPCTYTTMSPFSSHSAAPQNAEPLAERAYTWPEIDDAGYDVVILGQGFERVEFYWVALLEMRRILKKGGLLCIIAPSHRPEQRPVDCQRFYADGMLAMMKFIGLSVIYAYAEHESLVNRDKCDAIVVAEKPAVAAVPETTYREAHAAIIKLLPHTTLSEVSRRKQTFQSSASLKWQKNLVPGNAVSGIFTGEYSFHTDKEQEPWWMVDLERVYELETIKVFNRQGDTAERARQMDVLLSSDMRKWRTLYSNKETFGGILDGSPLVVKAHSASARYVRLQMRNTTILHLDQVQIFALL